MAIPKAQIRKKIIELASAMGDDKTICPSEVARAISPESWRELMGTVREIACELRDAGHVEITQKGKVVEGETFKGPIRIRISENE